jgi:hypothetical protein
MYICLRLDVWNYPSSFGYFKRLALLAVVKLQLVLKLQPSRRGGSVKEHKLTQVKANKHEAQATPSKLQWLTTMSLLSSLKANEADAVESCDNIVNYLTCPYHLRCDLHSPVPSSERVVSKQAPACAGQKRKTWDNASMPIVTTCSFSTITLRVREMLAEVQNGSYIRKRSNNRGYQA